MRDRTPTSQSRWRHHPVASRNLRAPDARFFGPPPNRPCSLGCRRPVALVLAPRFRHSRTWVVRGHGKEDASGVDVGNRGFAAVLTTSCWVPQLQRTLRRGTASDFAWPYVALLSVGLGGWFVYGILRDDLVIVVSNALVLGSVLVVISVKLRSRRLTFDHVELAVPAGTDPVAALESLVEIGPRLAADLRKVGIADAPSLRTVGCE